MVKMGDQEGIFQAVEQVQQAQAVWPTRNTEDDGLVEVKLARSLQRGAEIEDVHAVIIVHGLKPSLLFSMLYFLYHREASGDLCLKKS
jgi:hypothetical protein